MKFLKTEVDRTTKNFSRLLENSEMRILLIPKFNEEILLGNGTKMFEANNTACATDGNNTVF